MTEQEKKELVAYRIRKAKDTLGEVETQIQNHFLNNAVNRTYYACFYAVSALFVDRNISAKTHSGAKQMLGLHFVTTGLISRKANEFYITIFELRHTGDYDDYIVFEEKQVSSLLQPATDFIAEIESLLWGSNSIPFSIQNEI